MPINRRAFIQSTAACTALGVLPARAAAKDIEIGLSQYSLRQLFGSGQLKVEDYPKFAKENFGISAIDLWEGGIPKDKINGPKYQAEIRKRAEDVGSNIFLLMTNPVDAKGKTSAERMAAGKRFFPAADRAKGFGAAYLRVFLRAPDGDRAASIDASIEALTPLADYTKTIGITVAIEPAASTWSAQGSFLTALMEKMQHSHCKLMPDFGKYSGDIYEGTRVNMPHSVVVSAKSHDFDAEGNEKRFDYARLMKIVIASGFKGIVAIEYEGSHLGPVDGVKATRDLIQRSLA